MESQLPAHEFERRFAESWAPREWRDVHVVLAVSGGADSVAMLQGMVALANRSQGAGRLFAAHLNHGLRGADADADADFVKSLCDRLSVPLEVGQIDVQAAADLQGDGWESAARTARHELLGRTADRVGARFVATAHTADDQVETVLHRIVRGTGLQGLAGMSKFRSLSDSVTLVKPMLPFRRREVEEYLSDLGQDHQTDATNADVRFTRNRVRHELLPLLRAQFSSDVDGALLRLAMQAGDAHQAIEEIALEIAHECVTVEWESGADRRVRRVSIDGAKLVGVRPVIAAEVCRVAWKEAGWPLQSMGYYEWQVLADMACGPERRAALNLPSNVQARREGQHLVLTPLGLP